MGISLLFHEISFVVSAYVSPIPEVQSLLKSFPLAVHLPDSFSMFVSLGGPQLCSLPSEFFAANLL